jgi:hypothetical protein
MKAEKKNVAHERPSLGRNLGGLIMGDYVMEMGATTGANAAGGG